MRRDRRWNQALWWGLTTAYISLTYATLGAMPAYWNAINDILAGNGLLFQYALYTSVGVAVLYVLYGRGFLHAAVNLAATAAVIIVFAVMFFLQQNPGEKIHMFQYGVFGLLLYKALSLHLDKTSSRLYINGGLLCLTAGAVDEIIQGILPNRYFTLHDVVINGLSGVVVQCYVFYYHLRRRASG